MLNLYEIRTKLFDYKKFFENFFCLSVSQVFTLFYPFITYPYLIKVLGISTYGMIIFSQTICGYFSIVINWGFEAIATKDISEYRDNKEKLSEIISAVLIIKLMLWVGCFLILFLLVSFMDKAHHYKLLFLFSFLLTLNELLIPTWYFQGIEKMKYITFITIFIRSVFLICIFIFIHNENDYLLVPLLNAIGLFLGGAISIYIMLFNDKNKFRPQSVTMIFSYIKKGYPIFISNIIISIKDRFNLFFIGIFLDMQAVALYDIATKISNVFMQPIMLANNAIYPSIVRIKNISSIKKFIMALFIGTLLLIACVQPFLQTILNYLSHGQKNLFWITEILLFCPVILSISLALARNGLIIFGLYRYIMRGAVYTTSVYLLFILIGYMTNNLTSIYFFCIVTIVTFLYELLYRMFICYKYKLYE